MSETDKLKEIVSLQTKARKKIDDAMSNIKEQNRLHREVVKDKQRR